MYILLNKYYKIDAMDEPESMLKTKRQLAFDHDKVHNFIQNNYVCSQKSKVRIQDILDEFKFVYKS